MTVKSKHVGGKDINSHPPLLELGQNYPNEHRKASEFRPAVKQNK